MPAAAPTSASSSSRWRRPAGRGLAALALGLACLAAAEAVAVHYDDDGGAWMARCLATLPAHGAGDLPLAQQQGLCAALGPSASLKDQHPASPLSAAFRAEAQGDEERGFATFTENRDQDILNLVSTAVCVLCAALASGLTIGLMSIDPLELEIKAKAGTAWERAAAARVLPLVERHHLLLVSLLLLNATAAEALPIFLDALVPSWCAIVVSTTLVLVIGEILPTAVCTGPDQLRLAARLTTVVWFVVAIFCPLSYPIAKLLDCCFGGHEEERKKHFTPEELAVLLEIHHQEAEVLLKAAVYPTTSSGVGAGGGFSSVVTVPHSPPASPIGAGAHAATTTVRFRTSTSGDHRSSTNTSTSGEWSLVPGRDGDEGGDDGTPPRPPPRSRAGSSLTTRRLASTPGHAGRRYRRQLSDHAALLQQGDSDLTAADDPEGGGRPPALSLSYQVSSLLAAASSTLSSNASGVGPLPPPMEGRGDTEGGSLSPALQRTSQATTATTAASEQEGEEEGSEGLQIPMPPLPLSATGHGLPLAATPFDALRAYLPLSPTKTSSAAANVLIGDEEQPSSQRSQQPQHQPLDGRGPGSKRSRRRRLSQEGLRQPLLDKEGEEDAFDVEM